MTTKTDYWEERYKKQETGWDLGQISPPLKAYFDQIPEEQKDQKILIPGAGHGHEAVYLWQHGFTNFTLLDFSETAFAKINQDHPNFPTKWLCVQDFFDHTETYDLIIEQTFFCALNPDLRSAYAKKMRDLLKPEGKLVGLLFDRDFDHDGPPFGGNQNEYRTFFAPYFNLKILERCYNSIKPRQGSELFFIFENRAED